jgi:hypothetical protein
MVRARSLSARLVCLAVSTLVASVLCGVGPALADTGTGHPQSVSPASPTLINCQPHAGTVISSKPTSIATAWIPTSWSSSFIAGPASVTRTTSIASMTGQQLSASFQVDEGLFFVSAKETYGVQLSTSTTKTYTTQYTLTVPANVTAKMQQYHQGVEAGIRQVVEAEAASHKPECYQVAETSATGNYFPLASSADDTFRLGTTVRMFTS